MTDRVQFLDHHRPALRTGRYEITVIQRVTSPAADRFDVQRSFTIAGDGYTLPPADIYAVFPPEGSLGDHQNVLPHVVLNRSTLPWELNAVGHTAPWLALLLFTEEETLAGISPVVTTLAELATPTTTSVSWPGLTIDTDQHAADDKVTVIDVPRAMIAAQLPGADGLSLLTHVRRAEQDRAVVVGRRLPKADGISDAHLVSVAGRYTADGFQLGDAELVRLVVLKSWRFACADPAGDLPGLLTNLDRRPGALRLPPVTDREAEAHLAAGRVALPHRPRAGAATVSWYRGPFLPHAPTGDEPALPVAEAADLLRYDPLLDMFDASYAAAWELGRLLALHSKPLSRALYAWKRVHARAEAVEPWLLHPAWSATEALTPDPLPVDVAAWFDNLRLLRGVPVNYLIPDEHMLPPEGLRLLQVDPGWVECLLDGAFSIGRRTGSLRPADTRQRETLLTELTEHPPVTGFLMRSSVVSGWPGLLADGYAAKNERPLPMLRFDRLGPDLLLCLYAGRVARLRLHLALETLHFGTDRLTHGWHDDNGIADLTALATTVGITDLTKSGAFAAALVDKVPRITFDISAGGK